jgi:hypothetical protein
MMKKQNTKVAILATMILTTVELALYVGQRSTVQLGRRGAWCRNKAIELNLRLGKPTTVVSWCAFG